MLGGSNEAIKVREQGNAIRRRQKDNNIPELRRCVESITWNDNMEQGNAKKRKGGENKKSNSKNAANIYEKNESKKITLNKK